MNDLKKAVVGPTQHLEGHLKKGSITFTKSEAIQALYCSEFAFMRAAQRLQKKGLLRRSVLGFYVIVEVEFRKACDPTPIYFISKLMKYFKQHYYVGLLTAAKYHGATHQAVFETQVMAPTKIHFSRFWSVILN